MISKVMTYKDFRGNERTEELFFNLSKPELIKMSFSSDEKSLDEYLRELIATNDNERLYEIFEELILKAYGEVSEDGRSFKKSDELSEEFKSTAVYGELIMELLLDTDAAIAFCQGIVPADLADQINKDAIEKTVKESLNVVE